MRWKVLGFDQLRLVCSLLVLVGHARILSIGAYNWGAEDSPAQIAFFWLTSLGHSAVLVFFVLSGYLVGAPLVKSTGLKEINLTEFLVKRLSRIWIVLIPSFFVIAILNQSACSLDEETKYCKGELQYSMSDLPPLQMQSGNALLKSATFQFGDSKYQAFGGNLPLWSLNYEVFAYVLIAVLVYLFQLFTRLQYSRSLRESIRSNNVWILAGCLFWLLNANPTIESLYYFSIFSLGVMAGVFKKSQFRFLSWKLFFTLSLIQIPILGEVIRQFPIVQLSRRVSLIDFIFAAIFAILLMKSPEVLRSKHYYQERSLFDFSFSLYVIHLPILGLISALNESKQNYLELKSWQEFLLMIFLSMILSFVFSMLTEGHTLQLRNFLIRKFIR